MSELVQQKGNLIPVIQPLLENFYRIKPDTETGESPERQMARRYLDLSELKDYIETQMAAMKPDLIAANVYELFPEFDLAVKKREGSASSSVNIETLFDDLAAKNRLRDLVKVAKVTQKDLKTLPDGEVLLAVHKVEGTPSAPSVTVVKMTKDDWACSRAQA